MAPRRTPPITITIPEDWRDAFEERAAKKDQTIGQWLRELGLADLPASVRKKLSEAPRRGRPNKDPS